MDPKQKQDEIVATLSALFGTAETFEARDEARHFMTAALDRWMRETEYNPKRAS